MMVQNSSQNGSVSPILQRNQTPYICVGCDNKQNLTVLIGGERVQSCPRCKFKAMLPKDATEIEVLRLRVSFLETVFDHTVTTLNEVIESNKETIAELKGE